MTEFDPMEDPDISEAMHLMYGPILEQWSGNDEVNPTGLLLVFVCFGYLSFVMVAELGHSAAWTSVLFDVFSK